MLARAVVARAMGASTICARALCTSAPSTSVGATRVPQHDYANAANQLQPLLVRAADGEETAETTDEYPDVGFGMPLDQVRQLPNAETILLGTNHLPKKKGHLRIRHTLEQMLRYMESDTYARTYSGLPIRLWYRRNYPGTPMFWRQPPKRCIGTDYTYITNNPCPICRDEYLWFDFRNVPLLRQFMTPGTLRRQSWHVTGLCEEQYGRLKVELMKALDTGYITFAVPYRNYRYENYYADWKAADTPADLPAYVQRVPSVRPRVYVRYPEMNPDRDTQFDEWWKRWEPFAQKNW